MIDVFLQHQLSLFADISKMESVPRVLSSLMSLFEDEEMVPTSFHELSVEPNLLGQPVGSGPVLRPMLTSVDGSWRIRLATNRIDVEHVPIQGIWGPEEPVTFFIATAQEWLIKVAEFLKVKGNRLALNTIGLLKEYSSTTMETIHARFMTPLPFQLMFPPFEWTIRQTSRRNITLGSNSELLNVITDMAREQGMLIGASGITDRIRISFDINTHQDNTYARFNSDDIRLFAENAASIREEVLGDVSRAVDAAIGQN